LPHHATQRGNRREKIFFEEEPDEAAFARLRRSELIGRPLGGVAFPEAIGRQLGRVVTPGKRGRSGRSKGRAGQSEKRAPHRN